MVKNPPASAGRRKRCGFNLWIVGRLYLKFYLLEAFGETELFVCLFVFPI